MDTWNKVSLGYYNSGSRDARHRQDRQELGGKVITIDDEVTVTFDMINCNCSLQIRTPLMLHIPSLSTTKAQTVLSKYNLLQRIVLPQRREHEKWYRGKKQNNKEPLLRRM